MLIKLIARDIETRRQHKKWIYLSMEDYEKYGNKIIKRYLHSYIKGYEIERWLREPDSPIWVHKDTLVRPTVEGI